MIARLSLLLVSTAALALAGCEIAPKPISLEDTRARATADRARIFADQPPIEGPLTLHDAMARAESFAERAWRQIAGAFIRETGF